MFARAGKSLQRAGRLTLLEEAGAHVKSAETTAGTLHKRARELANRERDETTYGNAHLVRDERASSLAVRSVGNGDVLTAVSAAGDLGRVDGDDEVRVFVVLAARSRVSVLGVPGAPSTEGGHLSQVVARGGRRRRLLDAL